MLFSNGRFLLCVAGLINNFVYGFDHHIGAVELDEVTAVLYNHMRTSSREVRQFILHLLPRVTGGLDQIFGQVRLGLIGIFGEHDERNVAEFAGCGGLCGAFGNRFRFRHSFAGGVKVAFGGANFGIRPTESHETRNSEWHGEFHEFLFAQPGCVHIV